MEGMDREAIGSEPGTGRAMAGPGAGGGLTPPNPDYPIHLDVQYPSQLSRLLIFVKGILVIPHYLVLMVLGLGAFGVWIASWFAVLFTGRYPEGMFNYMVGVMRWGARVGAYQFLLTDAYPPFSLEDDPAYPVHLEAQYPAHIARWRPLVHGLLGIPAFFAASAIMFVGYIAVFLAWFAILFTGRYPEGFFNVVVIGLRWTLRANLFHYWMTERYPPFVWA